MLGQQTAAQGVVIEPAVIVAFFVGVLAFVGSGGLGWVFPGAMAWRRIEQRSKILQQLGDDIDDGTKELLVEDVQSAISRQLQDADDVYGGPDRPSRLQFSLQFIGLVVLSAAIGLAGWFTAQDAGSWYEQLFYGAGFGGIALLGLYGAGREAVRYRRSGSATA